MRLKPVTLLERLTLRSKLAILFGLAALGLIGLIIVGAELSRERMVQDRMHEARSVVLTARGIAEGLQTQVAAGVISHDEALARFGDAIHAIRFDDEDDYIVVNDYDGRTVFTGGDRQREGKISGARDAQDRPLNDLIKAALADSDGGFVRYKAVPITNSADPMQEKISYVARFAPWGLVIFAGEWIDDLDAAYHTLLIKLGAIGGGIAVLTLLALLFVNRDITRSAEMVEALARQNQYRAEHDALTGLANRTVLTVHLEQALVRAARYGSEGALLFIDLDGFKQVNDKLGHQAGDELLQQVAARLKARLRAVDTICRQGGDEFVALLEEVGSAARAREIADSLIATLSAPVTLASGRDARVGASIGVALFPREGVDSEAILRQADAALYEAKAAGKGVHRVWRGATEAAQAEG